MQRDIDLKQSSRFPTSAGILLGIGLGGLFDGIVLHQLLQWHHMASSAGLPVNSVLNLQLNVFLDGLFHVAAYLFLLLGLVVLWRHARQPHAPWSGKLLGGSALLGFGLFNLIEGVVNHHLLGLHHVNELVPRVQWLYWDIGFLLLSLALLLVGWGVLRAGQTQRRDASAATRSVITARPTAAPAAARAWPQSANRRRTPPEPQPGGRRSYDPPLAQPAG